MTTGSEVVRGEMQTWSDLEHLPAADPVVAALLGDLPRSGRALVAGPHPVDVVAAVASRHEHTTVLVRSVADARSLADALGDTCDVVAGSLDGLDRGAFDALVAAGGLDRVLGVDAPDLDWRGRLDLLVGHGREGATLVVGLENESSVTAVLDGRPARLRHGDEEWVPLHSDPSRPVGHRELVDALPSPEGRVLALSRPDAPSAAVDVRVLGAGHASWAARVLVDAIGRDADHTDLLAPPDDALGRLSRAGLLGDVAPGWLHVGVPQPEAAALVRVPGTGHVVSAGPTSAGWSTAPLDTGAPGPGLSAVGAPALDLPDGPSVEERLLALAEAEDVPGLRALAGSLGRSVGADVLPAWDLAVLDGDTWVAGPERWAHPDVDGVVPALAVAWTRFVHRLLERRARHPWPPWMGAEELVTTFVEMSGHEVTPATLEVAGRVARELADARGETRRDAPTREDLVTDLAHARRRLEELTGVVRGYERTLRFRDEAVRMRHEKLLATRAELKAERAKTQRLQRSRVVRLSRRLRRLGGR